MKNCLFLAAIIFLSSTGYSQEGKKFIVQAGNSISDVVSLKDIYSYSDFIEGKVSFKNGTTYNARLNYNLFSAQMQFINRKGDTLELANENTIKNVLIGRDTFFYDRQYFRLLAGTHNIKLAVQQRIIVADKQKIGAFGQPGSGAGVETVDRVVQINKLSLLENTILSKVTKYYLGDTYNQFVPLTRKEIMKMFSLHQNDIKRYLDESLIDFNKQEDLIKVINFLQNLAA